LHTRLQSRYRTYTWPAFGTARRGDTPPPSAPLNRLSGPCATYDHPPASPGPPGAGSKPLRGRNGRNLEPAVGTRKGTRARAPPHDLSATPRASAASPCTPRTPTTLEHTTSPIPTTFARLQQSYPDLHLTRHHSQRTERSHRGTKGTRREGGTKEPSKGGRGAPTTAAHAAAHPNHLRTLQQSYPDLHLTRHHSQSGATEARRAQEERGRGGARSPSQGGRGAVRPPRGGGAKERPRDRAQSAQPRGVSRW